MRVNLCRHIGVPHNAPTPKPKHQHLPHPTTPDIYQICSKRSFDGQVASSFLPPLHYLTLSELEKGSVEALGLYGFRAVWMTETHAAAPEGLHEGGECRPDQAEVLVVLKCPLLLLR